MIQFKQKDFSKAKEALKKAKDSPVTKTALAAVPTVLGVANLSLNLSRKKKDTELRKEQIRSMDDLSKALRESTDTNIKLAARNTKTTLRKKHVEDINDDDVIILPNPVSSIKKAIKK
mgnify:CR=1 FL=1